MFENILIPISSEFYPKEVFNQGTFLAEKFKSKITLIYIIEETTKEKRAFNSNIIRIAGTIGFIIAIILRSIFITDSESNWRAMMLFPIIFGFPLCIIVLLTLKETSTYQLMKEKELKLE